MELQAFVTESLSQILNGVNEAMKKNSHDRIQINPRLTFESSLARGARSHPPLPDEVILSTDGFAVVMVNFDISVTASEGTGTKGGIGVFVGAVGLGSQGQSDASKSSATKIQFKVPVVFAHHL
jgi:hypothetical protein